MKNLCGMRLLLPHRELWKQKLLSMFIKRTEMDRVIDLRLTRLTCPDLNLRFGSWKHPGEVFATLNGIARAQTEVRSIIVVSSRQVWTGRPTDGIDGFIPCHGMLAS